jgi:hypothetical protein
MHYWLKPETGANKVSIPAWTIMFGLEPIGFMTDFPIDGPTATFVFNEKEVTLSAISITLLLKKVGKGHDELMEDLINAE